MLLFLVVNRIRTLYVLSSDTDSKYNNRHVDSLCYARHHKRMDCFEGFKHEFTST